MTPSPEPHADPGATLTFAPTEPLPLIIIGEDGRRLLALRPDGVVEADLSDVDEAAAVLVSALQRAWPMAVEGVRAAAFRDGLREAVRLMKEAGGAERLIAAITRGVQ